MSVPWHQADWDAFQIVRARENGTNVHRLLPPELEDVLHLLIAAGEVIWAQEQQKEYGALQDTRSLSSDDRSGRNALLRQTCGTNQGAGSTVQLLVRRLVTRLV